MKYCTACNEKFDDSLSFCPTDGEVLEEDPTSLLGSVLDGQYQIEAILGKGGMGSVYRARHILLGDRVAIKLLPPEMRSNTEWLRRFQREGQAARRFRHPNAVTVYDLRTSADGTIYLVMECVEGTTLDAELKRHGRFSPSEALVVLSPIISVLNAAHAMGVVHRDLKPENIMIGKPTTGGEPVVKLLDLGIAKLREVAGAENTGTTALTIAGQMLGTPYYMSPEQWGELPRDGNSDIDGRADIYSLGIVFYELIAGSRPYSGMTLSELRREHVSKAPKPLRDSVPNVPEGFDRAILRATAKDRADRQRTAGELENELMTALVESGASPTSSIAAGLAGAGADSPTPRTSSPGRVTTAELTIPTLVGDAGVTEVEPQQPAAISNQRNQAATMPTMITSEKKIAEPAGVILERSPAPTRRSPLLIVGGLVVLLAVLGAGGFAVVHFMGTRTDSPNSNAIKNANVDLLAGAHEIGRYWLEVRTADKTNAIRAGESVSMSSGQDFRFHFSPSETGYLYIIGPGIKNAPTTFLTAKPAPGYGLKTNEVKSAVDFSFPADTSAGWITLDKTPGTEEFTIIFSTTALASPDFLSSAALHELTTEEQKQLADLRTQFKANSVGTEIIKTGASPAVAVKVPQTGEEGAPVMFMVRIEHN